LHCQNKYREKIEPIKNLYYVKAGLNTWNVSNAKLHKMLSAAALKQVLLTQVRVKEAEKSKTNQEANLRNIYLGKLL